MFRRLVNLPFSVAGKAARAFQAREDARIAAQFGRVDDPGQVVNNTHVLPITYTTPASVQISAAAVMGRNVHWVDVREVSEIREHIAGAGRAGAGPEALLVEPPPGGGRGRARAPPSHPYKYGAVMQAIKRGR